MVYSKFDQFKNKKSFCFIYVYYYRYTNIHKKKFLNVFERLKTLKNAFIYKKIIFFLNAQTFLDVH